MNTAAAPIRPSAPAPALASPSVSPAAAGLGSFAMLGPFLLPAVFVRAVIDGGLNDERRDTREPREHRERERDAPPLRAHLARRGDPQPADPALERGLTDQVTG